MSNGWWPQNLGTIKCSNLCTEIVEYTSPDEVAVCNLASIGLPMFVQDGSFDHEKLKAVTKVITRNLNKVIDVNYYPVPEAKLSNMRHRPIGIGVQGLADVFQLLDMPFDSDEAKVLNRDIMETIYFGAVEDFGGLERGLVVVTGFSDVSYLRRRFGHADVSSDEVLRVLRVLRVCVCGVLLR